MDFSLKDLGVQFAGGIAAIDRSLMYMLDDARHKEGDCYGARPQAVVIAHHNTLEVMSCAPVSSPMDQVPH